MKTEDLALKLTIHAVVEFKTNWGNYKMGNLIMSERKYSPYMALYNGDHAELWAYDKDQAKEKACRHFKLTPANGKLIIVVPKNHRLSEFAQLISG